MKIRETFMGKIVPPAVHGSDRELVEACRADDWNKACNCVDCTQVDCAECFFSRPTGNNTAEDLKRFADEYEKVHPSAKPKDDMDGMPEIKPGDVIIYECYPKCKKPLKVLAVGEASYAISAGADGSVQITGWGCFQKECLPEANAIYRGTDDYKMITSGGLKAIADLKPGCYPKYVLAHAKLIWKREEEVKELTVDEVSEKLGYKVKIVGSAK